MNSGIIALKLRYLKAAMEIIDEFKNNPHKQTGYATLSLIEKILEAEG